ncbi:MAG: hypothetical protein M1838_003485 [Thelocarpon superellum]|nr:MAG: hypothetical protein M1838_003485 [Thelocarpon superellum]
MGVAPDTNADSISNSSSSSSSSSTLNSNAANNTETEPETVSQIAAAVVTLMAIPSGGSVPAPQAPAGANASAAHSGSPVPPVPPATPSTAIMGKCALWNVGGTSTLVTIVVEEPETRPQDPGGCGARVFEQLHGAKGNENECFYYSLPGCKYGEGGSGSSFALDLIFPARTTYSWAWFQGKETRGQRCIRNVLKAAEGVDAHCELKSLGSTIKGLATGVWDF